MFFLGNLMIPNQIGPERADYSAIADYDTVHPSYGTPEDFRKVLESAHRMDDASL